MNLLKFSQRVYRRLKYECLLRGFFTEPRPLLRLLHYCRLDIRLFVVPYFSSYNRNAIKRLKALRRQGLKPLIVYFSMEGDGRFERLYEISRMANNTESVWFQFPIFTAVAESIIFRSLTNRGCGFYEDARMKYVDPVNDQNRARYKAYRIFLRCIRGSDWKNRLLSERKQS